MTSTGSLPDRLAVAATRCGFERVDPIPAGPSGLDHPPDAAADNAGRVGWVIVARGPQHADLAGAKAASAALLAHPGGQFRFAPHETYPSFLWLPVTGDDLVEVVAAHTRTEHAGGASAALSLGLVRDGSESFDVVLDEDPYCCSYPVPAEPDHGRGTPASRLAVDTLHTRSRVTLEVYGNLLTAIVRYAPSATSPVAAANRALGLDLPLDLPIDAAAFLLRWPVMSGAQLCAQLRSEAEPDQHVIALISAELIGAPLTVGELAIPAASHTPELRRAAIMVGGRRGFTGLLGGMRDQEDDPALRALIDRVIREA